MYILGIDTSCDDTSASVVADGKRILSNVVLSQTAIHNTYGGIVPELASRRHIEMIWPVVNEALSASAISLDEVNAIAVCHGPGLIGSLIVGCSFAKAVGFAKKIPLIAVNHLEGHIFSAFLEEMKPEFPFLSMIVSGGHTSLLIVHEFGVYTELGRTRDDAAGEAYDKIAKLLNLGYPGGPVIDRLAGLGNPEAFRFPRAYLPHSFDFSFSGLKTAVRNTVVHFQKHNSSFSTFADHPSFLNDVAASFQAAVVDVLVRKAESTMAEKGIRRIVLSGGVAANSELRKRMMKMAQDRDVRLFLPSAMLCTDNAAMIAAAGYQHVVCGDFASMDLNPKAYLAL